MNIFFQGWRFRHYLFLFGLSLFIIPDLISAQIGLKPAKPAFTVDLFEEELFGWEKYNIDSTFFKMDKNLKSYKRTVSFDSSGEYVSIREKLDDEEFYFPAVVDLKTYVDSRLAFNTRQLFKKKYIEKILNLQEAEFGAIKLDIPFRIRSETFTRIFGSDRISLRVTGNISFDISGRKEEWSGSAATARENQNTFSPRFSQTQQFTVEGKIGEKVTVSVQQNSEATTDIENTLKLRYDGDEDEIIQTIEAGNISLSLPSTKYVIFGGNNQGLFGLKANMRMGNLHMTTIASLEKGQQQELNISGGASSSSSVIKDYNFIQNRFFFLDMTYVDNWYTRYESNYTEYVADEAEVVSNVDVWVFTNKTQKSQGEYDGLAVLDPLDSQWNNIDIRTYIDTSTADVDDIKSGTFRKLSTSEYEVDERRGFIALNQSLDNNTALAVSYVVNGVQVGSSGANLDTSSTYLLKLLKPDNILTPNSATWPLVMKNVYSLGGSSIEPDGFEVSIVNNTTQLDYDGDKTYIHRFGLDNVDGNQSPNPDEIVDLNPYFVNLGQGTLMFPNLTPFQPQAETPFFNLFPESEDAAANIYNVTDQTSRLNNSKYEIHVKSKSSRTVFDLGFYVLEGSDVVTLNGKNLTRDQDYSIDYFSGQLTLLSPEAKRSSANIDIKYERANLFQLDKKTILGGRAEYRFLDNSFVGLTALYLNKTTIDRRVRVGQEPFQNFVWDINAAFNFKPRFLTRIMDALPLIETSAESQFNIEGEFAQVLPDPNTLNNAKTGDNSGVAYIDDFEASKRSTTLGIRYRIWTAASAPEKLPGVGDVSNHQLTLDSTRANFAWFNPYNQTPIKEIWPDRDVNSQTGQTTDVLGLEFYRNEGTDPNYAWAGMMRSTTNFSDQQRTKYIEMWIKGTTGTLNIDLGAISEDWYVKNEGLNRLNTEDKDGLGLLEDNEDTGIDGIPNNEEIGEGPDPSGDNWHEQTYDPSKPDNYDYSRINGTEGNSGARGTRYPDTEDINNNGRLNTANDYFTYSFSLDPDDEFSKQFITGETPNGWRQFRLPLSQPTDTVGNPDQTFQQVNFARLRISDIQNTEPERIFIATFDFVGNEWDERGFKYEADTAGAPFILDDNIFALTTYNTEENGEDLGADKPDRYVPPPGVSGERDRITNARSKEQSLVMQFNNLNSGYFAEAKKTLFSTIQLVNYKRMKMFLYGSRKTHGGPLLPVNPPDSSGITFYIRFGTDDNNYYEYGRWVYQGWENNNIDINLDELAALNDETKFLSGVPGGYYRAQGPNISLNNIRFFVIGVKNNFNEPFIGEIWLNELRLSEVRGESATALRVKTNLKLADVLNLTAEWESVDADFHNISTQFGTGNTLERQNYTGVFNFDKLLPVSWDMSMPVDARASFSTSIPKYFPRSDDLTGYRNNSFNKKMQSLLGLRELPEELEDQVSVTENYGVGTTIKKRTKSKHWLPRYTVDQLNLDFDYSKSNSSSWDIQSKTAESYKENYRFAVPFESNNFIQPFTFVKSIPVLDDIHDTKLYYTPGTINMTLNVNDITSETLRRDTSATLQVTKTTGTSRSISTRYKLLDNLEFDYRRTHNTDADFDSISRTQLYKNMFTKFDFGLETDQTQDFGAVFKPKIFSWLSTDFNFNTNYRFQLINEYRYKTSNNSVVRGIKATLNPDKLVNLIYTPEDKTKQPASTAGSGAVRGRPRPAIAEDQDQTKTDEEDKEKTEEEKQEEEASSLPNPLIFIYDMFNSWKAVTFNFNNTKRVSDQYLAEQPDWKYQFGFTQRIGVPRDSSILLENKVLPDPTLSTSNKLTTSTNVNIGKVSINLSHDYSNDESISNNGRSRTGSEAISYLALGKDPKKDFKGIESDIKRFVPNWTVNVSGIQEFLFFKEFASNISLNHGHSGKYDVKRRVDGVTGKFEPQSESFTNSWSPLISLTIRTVWDVDGTIRLNNGTNYSYGQGGNATRSENNSFDISMSYSKSSGFNIPLPFWPFKGRTFKNEINFNLSFTTSDNRTFLKLNSSTPFKEQTKNTSWKLRPSATYRFSTRVQGSMFFETGENTTKTTGTFSYSEFGISVNIAIRD